MAGSAFAAILDVFDLGDGLAGRRGEPETALVVCQRHPSAGAVEQVTTLSDNSYSTSVISTFVASVREKRVRTVSNDCLAGIVRLGVKDVRGLLAGAGGARFRRALASRKAWASEPGPATPG